MKTARFNILRPLLLLILFMQGLIGCSKGEGITDYERAAMMRLKQVGVALTSYMIEHIRRLPPAAMPRAKDGPPVSWRVLIMPYLGGPTNFKIDEPWDSPHNLTLLKHMPDALKPIGGPEVPEGYTRIRAIVGPDTAFSSRGMLGKKDGALALMVVETDDAVPWTKPEDWELDPNDPLKGLGHLSEGRFLALDSGGIPVAVLTSADPQRVLEAMIVNDKKPDSTAGLIQKQP